MDYFYRVRKVKRHYFLDFKVDVSSGICNTFTISLDNYLDTHDLHSTGLDFYGLVAGCRASGFKSVPTFSDYVPLCFTPSKDYFTIHFPTNFGYISPRGSFLRTGDFHLCANFRFHDFYNFFASRGVLILGGSIWN